MTALAQTNPTSPVTLPAGPLLQQIALRAQPAADAKLTALRARAWQMASRLFARHSAAAAAAAERHARRLFETGEIEALEHFLPVLDAMRALAEPAAARR
jgi:hypothetical protein